MGSSASTPNGANMAQHVPKLTKGKQIDAYDGKLWWPATIVEIHEKKKKTFHVLVRCENGYERKVLWGTPKHNKAAFKYIAPLGTHTRESLTATAASEQLSGSSGRGRTKKYDREKEEEEEEEEEDEDEDDGGEDSDEVPSFSSDYMNSIEEGDRHDVLDVYKSSKTGATARRWRKANIVRTNGPKVLVNFEGWSSEYNVWIDLGKEPTRIARIGEHTSSDQQPKKSTRGGRSSRSRRRAWS